jgi:hypothetical protein
LCYISSLSAYFHAFRKQVCSWDHNTVCVPSFKFSTSWPTVTKLGANVMPVQTIPY